VPGQTLQTRQPLISTITSVNRTCGYRR
jgi:hypothetical protein